MKKVIIMFIISLVLNKSSGQSFYGDMESWYSFPASSIMLEGPDHWYGMDSLHNATLGLSSGIYFYLITTIVDIPMQQGQPL